MHTLRALKAKHLMGGPVLPVRANWSLAEAARFFLEHHFSGAPVLDEDDTAVGVLTLKDIVRYTEWHLEAEESQEIAGQLAEMGENCPKDLHVDSLRNITVRAVMTPRIFTVDTETPMEVVLETLLAGPIHRVFVLDSRGNLEGVISSMDVVRTVARSMHKFHHRPRTMFHAPARHRLHHNPT